MRDLEDLGEIEGGFSPRSVCRVYSSGPIGVNPIPAIQIFLTDNNGVVLTDDLFGNLLTA